jgi:hypothetical protein
LLAFLVLVQTFLLIVSQEAFFLMADARAFLILYKNNIDAL